MQNLIPVSLQLTEAVSAAETFLLQQQHPDGCWRDYHLEPGSSEAWTTSVVLWGLSCLQPATICSARLQQAIDALYTLQKNSGWGYNRYTAVDADSTAWTSRLLAALQPDSQLPLADYLKMFMREDGSSLTFLQKKRFGTWAGHHADVHPMIGIALLQLYTNSNDPSLAVSIRNLRKTCINSAGSDLWKSFWWTTNAYAIACNLEFLRCSGGIPQAVLESAILWLQQAPTPTSAFETAQYLMIAAFTGAETEPYISLLLDTQLADGSWTASAVLLVPSQFNEAQRGSGYPDLRRLMSTAMVLIALKNAIHSECFVR